MVSQKLKAAGRLAKAGALHLSYMEELAAMPDRDGMTVQQQEDYAMGLIKAHVETCKGCSKARLVQLASDPQAIKAMREDFRERVK